MFTPSGSLWMTSTVAPVAARISGPTIPPDPFAQSRTIRSPPPSIPRASAEPVLAVALEQPGVHRPPGRSRRCGTEPSSSVRQISCSSSSSIASSSLRPAASRTLRPLSSAGLWDAETMIPAANVARAGEEREGRRRDAAGDVDVDAEARRARRDRRDEHVAGAARVLADDDRAALARRAGGRSPGPRA